MIYFALRKINMKSSRVIREVETNIPTTFGIAKVIGYRDTQLTTEHIAIVYGTPDPSSALARVHSECITGEAFHSLKCECGPQLSEAMRLCSEQSGIIIYLRGQEGRGIGLLNKLKAYALQEHGLDTVEANTALGFKDEEREFGAAVAILQDLEISGVRLLSNNPLKTDSLEEAGIAVVSNEELVVGLNSHNQNYMETKKNRMGHNIEFPES